MAKKKKIGECVYCGHHGKITDDHIPPKSIFPKPRPNNLIVVPSCKKCNSEASKDDEYFKIVLSMRYDTYEYSSAKENWPSILRSFKRPESIRLKNQVFETLKEVDLYTPAGIFIGKSGTYLASMTRVEKVLERIIKGLYFKEKEKRLSDNSELKFLMLNELPKLVEEDKLIVYKILNLINTIEPQHIGNDAFAYKIRYLDDNDKGFGAILTFFKFISFLIIAFPEEVIKKNLKNPGINT